MNELTEVIDGGEREIADEGWWVVDGGYGIQGGGREHCERRIQYAKERSTIIITHLSLFIPPISVVIVVASLCALSRAHEDGDSLCGSLSPRRVVVVVVVGGGGQRVNCKSRA